MNRNLSRKYRKTRIAFKHELKEICKQDKILKIIIHKEYRILNNKKHIFDIYNWLGINYHNVWNEFCKTSLWMNFITGECGIWKILLQTYPEIAKKYIDKIPEKCAMGDVLAVVYNLNKGE